MNRSKPINSANKIKVNSGTKGGLCGICEKSFLPDDIIERDQIVPLALSGKNLRSNGHLVHNYNYCHREKTNQ